MARLKIKEIAEAKGFSMGKLSRSSDISLNTIRSIFKNPYKSISTDTLVKIAKALDVQVGELIEYEDKK